MATQPIENGAIEQIVASLEQVLRLESDQDRHGQLGVAMRTITRLWAEVNPDFDRDAFGPVSFMLTEHWDRIKDYMASM